MAEPFIGEIRIFSFGLVPKGWAQCNGQILEIEANQTLFTLLRWTYGGDNERTFALPDLRGRVAIQHGQGMALSPYTIGQTGGQEAHALTASEGVAHGHAMIGSSNPASAESPNNHFPATSASGMYATQPPPDTYTTLGTQSISVAGGGQPHENRQPFLAVNVCIALQGRIPTQT